MFKAHTYHAHNSLLIFKQDFFVLFTFYVSLNHWSLVTTMLTGDDSLRTDSCKTTTFHGICTL